MNLSERGLRAFAAVADALLPALQGEGTFCTASASDLGVADRFPDQFARFATGHTLASASETRAMAGWRYRNQDGPPGTIECQSATRPTSGPVCYTPPKGWPKQARLRSGL